MVSLLPADPVQQFQQHEVIATLTPGNLPAGRHLSQLISMLQSQPSSPLQCQTPFVFLWSEKMRPIGQVLNMDSIEGEPRLSDTPPDWPSSFDSDTTVPNEDCSDDAVWHGCYAFSLRSPPRLPLVGWTVGYGPLLPFDFDSRGGRHADVFLAVGPQCRSLKLHKNSPAH